MITFAAQFFYCGNINHYLVKADDFLSLYSEDSMVKMLANEIMLPSPSVIHLKGLRGCLDTLLAASMQKLTQKSHLFVLQDKEEAFFFLHNLESLLGKGRLLFFPVSYRKPYEYEEVDNANVLQRAETLTELAKERSMIVTYPEALGEKVITRKSLSSHTFRVKKGETADRAFLEEFLHSYHFEKTDFVYEPGQFSVRGGLVDV
ncbi:MAG: transcription-repair coupling factor, partial [Candidatus Nephrothrix sp. EaCA]